jgi:DNA polymerase delta subunit 1
LRLHVGRSALERGIDIEGVGYRNYQCFEANMPFVLRFLIDRDIPGCCWLEAPANTYSIRSRVEKVSSCQLEIDIVYDSLVAHQPDGPWLRIAPYRILSFDIECAGRKGIFPEPEIDPVIQIANVVTLQGSSVPLVKNIFVLSTCSAIPGSAILSFEREGDLLEAWSRFVREVDPDLITGYNIANFDIPYLIKRAKALMVRNFTLLGRVKGK